MPFCEDGHNPAGNGIGVGFRLRDQELSEPVLLRNLVVVDEGEEVAVGREMVQAGVAGEGDAAPRLVNIRNLKVRRC